MSRGSYRSIYTVLIDGPDYQALSPHAKLVLITLKLNLGPTGIDVLYPTVLEPQTGLTTEQVALALDVLDHQGWIQREKNVVWIVDGLRHEPTFSVKNANHRAAILAFVNALPRVPIIGKFKAHYGLDRPLRRQRPRHAMGDGITDAMGDHYRLETIDDRLETRDEKQKKRKTPSAAKKRAAVREQIAFDQAWKIYPRRSGSNPKLRAQRAWNARIGEGVPPGDLVAGVRRYAEYCEAEHKSGTQFVLQAGTFFGPERRWAEPWTASANGADPDEERVARLVAEEESAARSTQELIARRRGAHSGVPA